MRWKSGGRVKRIRINRIRSKSHDELGQVTIEFIRLIHNAILGEDIKGL